MFVSDCLGINNLGHLTIGGKDCIELAGAYGTPLYVMDENQIRDNLRRYISSIETHYGGHGMVAYASKAFCCKAMCALVASEGAALDVVSGGELHTALEAGFPAERILFHGNNKTTDEITFAMRSGVGRIVVDNVHELELIGHIAASVKQKQAVQFRLKPGVDANTHNYMQTGQIDSKFGFAIETGEAMEAVRLAAGMNHIKLAGVHCHIGSQIFDIQPFVMAAKVLLGFMADVRDELGIMIEELNLGGGFGIQYIPEDSPAQYGQYMQGVASAVREICTEKRMKMPFIFLEPGRSVVGSAGITLYSVGAIKDIPGVRTYLTVDGGMPDNPRYALYDARYTMLLAGKAAKPKTNYYTIAGRCCESGDLLGRDIPLQQAAVGDALAVLATGAYNYSMASNYNRLPKPAVVFVRDGEARVAVRRQTYEDLVREDV